MAITMSDEQEAYLREKSGSLHDWPTFGLGVRETVRLLLAELDATRARVAELERERDDLAGGIAEVNAHHAVALAATQAELERERTLNGVWVVPGVLLAATQDERDEARAALQGAVDWMEEDGCDCGSDDARCRLCEAKAILARPVGSVEALRAWGVKVWDAACESVQKVERAYAAGQIWLVTKEETRERDIARLLEPTGDAPKGQPADAARGMEGEDR